MNTHKQLQKNVMPELEQKLIPPVIDYLWELAEEVAIFPTVFILERSELGMGEVQVITLRTRAEVHEQHRVFGFAPVDCIVTVTEGKSGYQMQLKQ